MAYIPPVVDQSPYSGPEGSKRKASHFAHLGDVLLIGGAVGLVAFLAALITAILTA
jgi:hypothetical protein